MAVLEDISEGRHINPYAPGFQEQYGNVPNNMTADNYASVVDMVDRNNTFSAEQAENQMNFQRSMFEEANRFNADQAEIDRRFQQDSANRAMDFSSAENAINRDWQKMMSDTAHRREMEDLKAAGLNPILAANNGASAGSGSSAMSAQAAGYGASSSPSPSGSKADADQSGTMAIANLLGKMLDNNVELEKMRTSAETARETADMYTGATRYAAELAQIASLVGSERSHDASVYGSDSAREASRYAADLAYAANLNNPMNLFGNQLGNLIEKLGDRNISVDVGLDKLFDFVGNMRSGSSSAESSYDRTMRYIDTAGTGVKGVTSKVPLIDKIKDLLKKRK